MGGKVNSVTIKRWGPGKRVRGFAASGIYTESPSFTNTVLAPKWGASPSPLSLGKGSAGVSRCPSPPPPTVQFSHPQPAPHPLLPGSSLFSIPSAPSHKAASFHSPQSSSRVCSQRHRRVPIPVLLLPSKFCLAGSLPKPLVPTILPSLGDSPPPAQQPQGWAGAIFSLGTELILTHRQGTWGRTLGLGGGREGQSKKAGPGAGVVSGPRHPKNTSRGRH